MVADRKPKPDQDCQKNVHSAQGTCVVPDIEQKHQEVVVNNFNQKKNTKQKNSCLFQKFWLSTSCSHRLSTSSITWSNHRRRTSKIEEKTCLRHAPMFRWAWWAKLHQSRNSARANEKSIFGNNEREEPNKKGIQSRKGFLCLNARSREDKPCTRNASSSTKARGVWKENR